MLIELRSAMLCLASCRGLDKTTTQKLNQPHIWRVLVNTIGRRHHADLADFNNNVRGLWRLGVSQMRRRLVSAAIQGFQSPLCRREAGVLRLSTQSRNIPYSSSEKLEPHFRPSDWSAFAKQGAV
jgi:hypothetical protein